MSKKALSSLGVRKISRQKSNSFTRFKLDGKQEQAIQAEESRGNAEVAAADAQFGEAGEEGVPVAVIEDAAGRHRHLQENT